MEAIKLHRMAASLDIEQRLGEVVDAVEPGQWQILTEGPSVCAHVAASCLLEPGPGDRVLLATAGDEAWILAVLERGSEATARLRFGGDVRIESEEGALSLHSAGPLNVTSSESVRIASPVFSLCANAAEHFVQGVTWVGRKLVSTFDSIRTVSRTLDTLSETRRDQSRNSIRNVEQMDRVHSGRVDYRADQEFTIRGRHLVAKGRELAKIDSKQIQLG